MSKPKVVFLDRATIPSQISLKALSFEHEWVEYDFTQPNQVAERIADAEIVITNKVVLNASNLSFAAKLRFIAVSATGVNNIDLEYCQGNGISVSNIQGYATQSVPEHVIAMLFALKRNLKGYHQDIERDVWQRDKQFCFFTHPIQDIAGSTLGIFGSGSLGQATAVLAKAIGMQVGFAERKGASTCREGYTPFEEVLRTVDAISLHCPLTTQTENLISREEFQMMKSNCVLINAGRGGLVDGPFRLARGDARCRLLPFGHAPWPCLHDPRARLCLLLAFQPPRRGLAAGTQGRARQPALFDYRVDVNDFHSDFAWRFGRGDRRGPRLSDMAVDGRRLPAA